MVNSWQPSFHTSRRSFVLLAAAALCFRLNLRAQAQEDALSQQEVDQLRDAAFTPVDRVRVYQRILDDRIRALNDLITKRRGHTDFAPDVHDLLDQICVIANELNDNLDEYSKHHRDVRKALPKLSQASEHWTATIQLPPENEDYAVVRRMALDNVKDTRELAQTLQSELDTYFKAHPEALKDEKRRDADPHAVESPEGP